MKQKYLAGLIIIWLLVPVIAVHPVIAQTSHNLEWGVQKGDEFVYALQRKVIDTAWEEYIEVILPFTTGLTQGQKAIANVTSLDVIPVQIEEEPDMPNSRCSLRRENDSSIILTNYTLLVVPTGNWTFLTDIGGFSDMSGVTVLDTDDEWGTIVSGTSEAFGSTVSVYQELRYEKESGTLTLLRVRFSTLGVDMVDIALAQWHEGMPIELPPDLQLSTVLVGIFAGLIGVIIAIFVYKRYRGKPLIQQLGE